jgi:signal transduction histidine kinase
LKQNQTKQTIYIRILGAFLVTYLVLMAGFTFFLIDREKKIVTMELGTFAGHVNSNVTEILQEQVNSQNQIQDIVKFKTELIRQLSFLTHSGTEMAVFTGDYELIFNTNDYLVCSYTERVEGTKHYTGYAYLNLREWFDDQEITELEHYLSSEPRARKAGDLSGYSVSLEGFWLDNEMVIPDTIRVVPMHASRFDEAGNVTSAGGTHDDNNAIYISNYQDNRDLPYFEHGGIQGRNNPDYDPLSLAKLREMVIDKENLKAAVQDIISLSESESAVRTNFFTYQYYLAMPYKNAVDMTDGQEPYSEFWTAMAREVDLWDRCASTLAFVWGSCFLIFIIVALILARQTYRTYQKSEALEGQRQEMTNALAHDLKTPLSIISGYAQNLLENVHTEKREHYAEHILANIDRMDKIIQTMLNLSKLESDSWQIKLEEVSLNEIGKKMINRYQPVCEEKSIMPQLEGETVIKADTTLIERVMDNFFVNALEHTPDGGTIRIKITENKLALYNSGSHIPQEKLQEIWQPYKKADMSRGDTKGTGLGLSIARGILESHKFPYGAENTDDGVVFWFKFE